MHTIKKLSSRCTSTLSIALVGIGLAMACAAQTVQAQARVVQTPYTAPKVVFDFYLDNPAKMGAALYWLRSFMNPLVEAPYSMFKEDISAVVLLHGTEIVTVAKHNEDKYLEQVQRMRYYVQQGVKFRVCGLAMKDYGYQASDLQSFIEVAPSAITELVHWQNLGYALVSPRIQDKVMSIEQIR